MTYRVRFAPSPTGDLHIGGARTALYDFLLAKHYGGQYVLRVEDTDLERSSKESEEAILSELKWLGVGHDEGPDVGGSLQPYRQSERLQEYKELALKLVSEGKAFFDFCSQEELDRMKEKHLAEGTPSYTGRWREESSFAEAKVRVEAGESAPIRLKVNPAKSYTFKDIVRGEVRFPAGMVGDFIILRSNGLPTYNYCNVIDDHFHQITHVYRAEEHLNNTLRQLMVADALGYEYPNFGHLSIMIGEDRQKLSKRHGAVSVKKYRELGYLPQALNNYLCLLGWSHPEEKSIFKISELYEVFDEKRFNKSPAMYDIEKLKWTNAQHLKLLTDQELLDHADEVLPKDGYYGKLSEADKLCALKLFVEKIQLISEVEEQLAHYLTNDAFEESDDVKAMLELESTKLMAQDLKQKVSAYRADRVQVEDFKSWMNHYKKEMKIKGKPLFMGLRVALTGQNHGPDLAPLISLIPKENLIVMLNKVMA